MLGRGLHRRGQRPGRRHRAGHPDGARVRPVPRAGAGRLPGGRLGVPGTGGGGPGLSSRALRRGHPGRDRQGGLPAAAGGGGARGGAAARPPRGAETAGRPAGREGDRGRRRGIRRARAARPEHAPDGLEIAPGRAAACLSLRPRPYPMARGPVGGGTGGGGTGGGGSGGGGPVASGPAAVCLPGGCTARCPRRETSPGPAPGGRTPRGERWRTAGRPARLTAMRPSPASRQWWRRP